MRFKRTAAIAGALIMAGGLGSAAMAAGTLSTSNLPPVGGVITVSWTGLPNNSTVYIEQCNRDGNAAGVIFTPLSDCSQATSENPSTGPAGSGTQVFTMFGGDEPNEAGWGCGPNTTGIKYDTCYVRLVTGVRSNVATDEFYPVTFTAVVDPNPVVSEVPLNILLPLSAAAVLGGGYYITRKRKLDAAA